MLRSILIGLDGSVYSAAAVDLGIRWARRFDCLLVGLGVIDEPNITQPEPLPLGAGYYKEHLDEARLKRAQRQVEQFLEEFVLRCAHEAVPAKVLEEVGLPHEQIMLEAQRYDLILLGQQTHFQFMTQDRACDTLEKVLRNTPRPVVTVPERLPEQGPVVVAYDGSLQAARAIQAFEGAGLGSDCDVHVITIDDTKEAAARRAGRAAEFLRFHDIKVTEHALASRDTPASVILGEVQRLQASLLVMGAYGQPTLREFFLGSATKTIIKETKIPLFLYH